MEFISSDTNVWIDFKEIDRIRFPFMLPYTYIMYYESIESEILNPPGLSDELRQAGLLGVDLSDDEFYLADSWGNIYPKLSVPDRIALVIAKVRRITLLTGDMALRRAARKEGVELLGTIGILDQLYRGDHISADEYRFCLLELQKRNGTVVRLPEIELKKRLDLLD